MLLLLLTAAWYVRYPDIIQANAVLTAANAPKEIIVRQGGKLIKLFAGNDDKVAAGQAIGWIESTADHKMVLELGNRLERGLYLLSHNETEKVSGLFDGPFRDLGELQTGYQQFINEWQQFNDYLVNGYYSRRKKVLIGDYATLRKMHITVEQQDSLTRKDLQLTQQNYDAGESLLKDSVISRQDFRDLTSRLVTKQLNIPQLDYSLLNNESQQMAKLKEIDELEHTISQQKTLFQQALQTLQSMIEEWKKKYILTSPADGKVIFIIPLQENQFLNTEKLIGYVNPSNSRYYAQIILPQDNFGKVATGQVVQLRFDAYPSQEFGVVTGSLYYISKIPTDSGFLANIELPDGLMTNFHKEIQYRNGLRSQAMIITRDARLLERFYYNFLKGIQR